jgi:tetratricopeptide (TPR) repeat protein
MKKYRIRLKNGRVIGPITAIELPELAAKGHISGSEEYQLFPTGDWKTINYFEDLSEMIDGISPVKENEEATFLKKISKKEIATVENTASFPEKFKYEKRTPFSERPEVTVKESETSEPEQKKEIAISIEDLKLDDVVKEDLNTLTKTVTEKPSEEDNQDKTIVNIDTVKYLEELKKAKEKADLIIKEEVEIVPDVDLDNDSTQFIDITSLKSEVKSELKKNESLFKSEKKQHKKELEVIKKNIEKKNQILLEAEKEENEDEDENQSPIKKIIVVGAVIALVLVILFPEDKKKELKRISIKNPEINFPIRFDVPSEEKATLLYNKAIKLIKSKNTYTRRIQAAKFFRESLENNFEKNKAAGKLIFLYSQLLENSVTKIDDANTIFKLVQIFKNKAVVDPTFAAGIGLFYLNMGKSYAAVKVIEKFNAVKKNSPTLELFAVYLKSLISTGDLVKAKAVALKLETIPSSKRPLFVQVALIEYFNFISSFEKSSEIVIEANKVFKDSVPLMLNHAKLLIYDEDFETLNKVLIRIRKLNVESSKIYYAKYLEYKALYSVSKGKIPNAIKYFKKALKTHESTELRSRLASLSESTNLEANNIISESKSLELVNNSKAQLKKNNWRFAFKDALEATRIAPDFVTAKLYLAKLQTSQSLFKEAIDILEKLYENDPLDKNIIYSLIDTYILSYKFTDVKRMLTLISGSDMRNDPRFFSLSAKFYVYKDDYMNALPWLQRAINKNPLDDDNIFLLAKMYIKYNKFQKGKMQLNKAMDLDPSKIEYRITFSNILYEIDGADASVGYLYNLLQDFPDNAKLISQIGIFQYRSGQLKSFNNTKEKLSNLPHKDTTLYEFLIEAAKLDDKLEEVILNSRKLIQLDPGNLKVRLNLGKTFMEMDRYKEALIEFKAIEHRLDTYPNLQLYMSKLFLLTDDFEKAKELATKEIKANSSSEFGYILLGDIYSKEKEYLQAEKQYKIAQKINGDNVEMLIGLAKINFKKSQYELALDLFLKARNNAPERSEIHKLLGDAYRKMSQSSLATESYKLFLELSPTSKYKDEINTYIRMMQ